MSRAPLRLLLILIVPLAALEIAARLFVAWDDDRRLPLAPTGARHAALVADYLHPGQAELHYLRHHPVLGWTLCPSFRPKPGEPGDLYSTNAAGLRGTVEVAVARTPGRLRIACFGDSYTHGDDVGDADTWPRQMEALLGGSAEVLNFGVPGYGPDQALLRYREQGRDFRPDVVILALADEDAARLLTVFRPFYTFHHFDVDDLLLPKPRFELCGGRLALVPNPLPRLADLPAVLDPAFQARMGLHDDYWRDNPLVRPPLPARLSAFVRVAFALYVRERRSVETRRDLDVRALRLCREVVAAFAREAAADGARFGVALLPERFGLGGAWHSNSRSLVRSGLLEFLSGREIPRIDLDGAFAAALAGRPPAALVPGHYSPEGNGVAARRIAEWLAGSGLLAPAAGASSPPGEAPPPRGAGESPPTAP